MNKTNKIGIIGAGNVGKAISEHLFNKNMLEWVLARSNNSFINISGIIPKHLIIRSLSDIDTLPKYIILAVSENSIKYLAKQISDVFTDLSGLYFTHCSGTLSKYEIESLKKAGSSIAATHPYQTFYNSGADTLKNIPWGIDAENDSETQYSDLIEILGGKPVILSKEAVDNKELYHISAVAASNYLNTLISFSSELLKDINLDAETFLKPIIETTLKNNYEKIQSSKDTPLTGPIVRGDTDTIMKHITALNKNPSHLKQYQLMGRATLELAYEKQIIPEKKYKELKKIFT